MTLQNLELERGTADVTFTLDAELAGTLYAPLLERLQAPVRRALRDAGIRAMDVQRVLLVGGATRLPAVRELAGALFAGGACRTMHHLPPDEAVALGAAVQAGLIAGDRALDDVVATDIAPHSLGISTLRQFAHGSLPGVFSPILERGTVIPASRVEVYSTVADNQTELQIEVFQGEHTMCRDNVKLGEYRLRDLPRRAAGEVSVEVRFSYNPSALLEVDLTVAGTDRKEAFVIEPTQHRLSPAELERRRARLASLKVHPRHLLPNATALARAEALVVELRGMERAMMAEAITAFESALERQDAELIRRYREHLTGLVQSLGRR